MQMAMDSDAGVLNSLAFKAMFNKLIYNLT